MFPKKKSVGDFTEADLKGKKVFLRVDFNTPLDKEGKLKNDSKIREALPTILYLIKRRARVILASHLGYFVGSYNRFYSMKLFLPRLSELLGIEVKLAHNCTGPEVERLVDQLREGQVLLLENLNFRETEMGNQPEFAETLASLADLFVNDAFPISHKPHASTYVIPRYLRPAVTGLLMQKELECLSDIGASDRPLVAVVGGSKFSSKVELIRSLLGKVDKLLLGGAIVFPFYVAHNRHTRLGSSLVNRYEMSEEVETSKSFLEMSKKTGVELLLPKDVMIGNMVGAKAKKRIASATNIPDNWMGLDIGPMTIECFSNALDSAKTIVWNGPMGMYEYDIFSDGTKAIAKKLAELTGNGVKTIIAGGDTVAAVEKLGLTNQISHVSRGSLASIELLAGKELPAVDVLDDDDTPGAENKESHRWSFLHRRSLVNIGIAVLILLQLGGVKIHMCKKTRGTPSPCRLIGS